MAVAAVLCVLGLENKVQAILLIGTLPVLILPFGSAQGASVAFLASSALGLGSGNHGRCRGDSSGMGSLPLIVTGFDRALLDAAQFHPLLLGRFGIYQPP